MATILIVDDRASNRQFLATLLGYGGHRLLEAVNGSQALDLTRKERPDLVITDILMPGMDGFEYVQRLRADPELSATRVIFHTATYSAPEARALAQSCGVEICLPKPCEPQEIIAAVTRMLGVAAPATIGGGAADNPVPARPDVDDTGRRYIRDLQSVKLGFDEVVQHSEKLIAQRDLARGVSKQLRENVDSLQRIMSRLSALVEVGMEMEAERDPEKLVRQFFSAACDIIDSKYAGVALLDEQAHSFAHVCTRGLDADLYRTGENGRDGLLGALLEGRRALRAQSADAAPATDGLPARHPPIRGILALPVATTDRVYGWLYFADRSGAEAFSAEDERLANIMASKLALLYENLLLYDVIQRHAAKLQIEAAERMRAQEVLRERETALRRAQAMAGLSHVVTGAEGEFLDWSATLPALAGVPDAAMPASTREWMALIHPEDRAAFRAASIGAGRSGERANIEYRLVREDGNVVHVRQVMEPLESRGGARRGGRWFNTLQDVTLQRRAADALRENEARLRALFEQAAVGVVQSALDGRIEMVNPKFCELLGHTRAEAERLSIKDTTHPEDVEGSVQGRRRLLSGPDSFYIREARLVRKDGSDFWAQITTSRVDDARGQPAYFISFVNDVSERRRAEERVRRLNRVHAVLSSINGLIVRVTEREELYREACRIAVDAGEFRLAWIGIVDRTALQVTPWAWSGAENGFLTTPKKRFPLGLEGAATDTLVARAVRERHVVVSNDARTDPLVRFQQEHADRGTHAFAVFPLFENGEVAAVLALYAVETGFFDQDEMKLLRELAGDLSFALDHIARSERAAYLASYDALTDLPNRAHLHGRLTQQIHAAGSDAGGIAVLFLDIERFKGVNDTLGRHAGDLLLRQVAGRLREQAPIPMEIARIGVDHFAILLPDVRQENDAARFAEQVLHACFDHPFDLDGTEVRMGARAGIAMFPADGTDADTLLHHAEAALSGAKAAGRRYVFYAREMTERVAGKLTLENELRLALGNEEFVLFYQPKVRLEDRAIVGVEALIRWKSPQRGLVPPLQFIPLLEETGLILDVGAWAMRRAVLDHRHWLRQGLAAPRVAVNVSQIQLRQREFVDAVRDVIREGANPTGLDLEITESQLMEDLKGNVKKLTAIRESGITLAIDDFGTGYSSLGYLAKLPVQALKIDRSFIVNMLNDADAMVLVQTIISLAHALRLKVVAEGVETEEQARMLRLLRCDEIQGYLIAKPLPIEDLTPLLHKT